VPPLSPQHLHIAKDPLTSFGSLTEFHQCVTTNGSCFRRNMPTIRPFQGFEPFSVFPATRSHLIPADIPCPPVTLRPQGFSPSRRFAPPATCQAYFILDPLLGFSLRGIYPPHGAEHPFGCRLPLEVSRERRSATTPPTGFNTPW